MLKEVLSWCWFLLMKISYENLQMAVKKGGAMDVCVVSADGSKEQEKKERKKERKRGSL